MDLSSGSSFGDEAARTLSELVRGGLLERLKSEYVKLGELSKTSFAPFFKEAAKESFADHCVSKQAVLLECVFLLLDAQPNSLFVEVNLRVAAPTSS